MKKSNLQIGLVLVLGIVFSLVAAELCIRAYHGTFGNFDNLIVKRHDWSRRANSGQYDPQLGWTVRPENNYVAEIPLRPSEMNLLRSFKVETDSNGFRKTPNVWGVAINYRAAPILTLGDSFTMGWEVNDHETWQTHLQALLKQPIINGGVNKYGLDQMLIRLEQLLPNFKYQTVILEVMTRPIQRTGRMTKGYKETGIFAEKPYFIIEGDKLLVRNSPPKPTQWHWDLGFVRNWLGRSYFFDLIFRFVAFDFWLGTSDHKNFPKAFLSGEDPVKVSCLLLQRFESLAKTYHFRPVVLAFRDWQKTGMSYQDETIVDDVIKCSKNLDLKVIDLGPQLKSLFVEEPPTYNSYFYPAGHMTNHGNLWVAKQLTGKL